MSGCFHVNVTSSHVVCVFSPTVVYAYTIYANYLGNVVLARLSSSGCGGCKLTQTGRASVQHVCTVSGGSSPPQKKLGVQCSKALVVF